MTAHNFTRGALLNDYVRDRTRALTDDAMARIAPSIFAQQAHADTSSRYTYIPTSQIVEGLRKAGFMPIEARQARTRNESKQDYTKHMIKFIHSDAKASHVGDVIPQVCLVNAHDGSSAYKIYAGLYRYVCSNGLLVCDANLTDVKVRHSGDIIGNVIEGSYTVIRDAQEAAERVQEWRGIELAKPEQLTLANAALAVRFGDEIGKTLPVKAEKLLTIRRSADQGNDLWSVFNVVQENVIKGGVRYFGEGARRQRTRAVTGIDQDTNLNRALWRLAEEMKSLKVAA